MNQATQVRTDRRKLGYVPGSVFVHSCALPIEQHDLSFAARHGINRLSIAIEEPFFKHIVGIVSVLLDVIPSGAKGFSIRVEQLAPGILSTEDVIDGHDSGKGAVGKAVS